MKKLILPLVLLPILAWAEVQEISDGEIKNKFLTVVKDVEVEGMLSKTTEFNDCREKNKFDPKASDKDTKLKEATECFKKKLSGKNPEALKKLADDLNLQSYGLIKSKNVSDITDYLTKKMIKSLTGQDQDKVTKESLQWKNQKVVDQKVFIDLYTNQLVKSALMEVSRFCFENLRNNSATTSFEEHWGPNSGIDMSKDPAIGDINDQGKGEFFKGSSSSANSSNDPDPSEVYKNLISGITSGKSIDATLYNNFFGYCQKALPVLCDDFKKNGASVANSSNNNTTTTSGTMSKGANACLTLDRLRSIRTAMKNTELVAKQFDEMGADKNKFALKMLNDPKIYQRGNGQGEESLDELSSFSSSDMLEGAEKNDLAKLEEKCKAGGEGGSECDEYLVKGDDLDKAINNVETEMNLKREIEIERVKQLKTKPEELEKYLTDNGLFDLLEKFKDPNSGIDIEAEIGKVYDARKVAEIEALKLKVGKRQVSEDEYKTLSDTDKADRIKENITETKEERARLAQVVMFNNIITSQLSLKDKKTGKEVGRNVNAWKKEMKGLSGYAGYSDSDDLFTGLQDSAKDSGTVSADNASVVGADILEAILGKPADSK